MKHNRIKCIEAIRNATNRGYLRGKNVVEFKFAVSNDTETVGLFVARKHAEAFARPGETVAEAPVFYDFEHLSIPRRNIAGEEATTAEECIGVW